MTYFSVERTQHPVGQGGFHSSCIEFEGDWFGIIYDCGGGTEERREKLIEDLVRAGYRGYDWLVVSHLDEDHINGIPQLESHGITFTNVFLPHVDLGHAMFMMLLRMIDASAGAITEQRLRPILIAGRLYAGAYGRATIVARGGDTPDQRPLPDFRNAEGLTPPDMREPSEMLDDDSRQVLGAPRGKTVLRDTKSIYVKHVGWELRFYTREWTFPDSVATIWNLPVFATLRHAINHLGILGTNEGKDFTTGIQAALDEMIPRSVANAAIKAFKPAMTGVRSDVSVNSLLKKLYKALPDMKSYNSASLCLYSGPTSTNTAGRRWYQRHTSVPTGAGPQPTRHVAWLGLGDAHFHTDDELEAFVDHYRRELRFVSTLMLPHHGSELNYDKQLRQLHGLLQAAAPSRDLLLIAASNPDHKKYKHPHQAVVLTAEHYGTLHNVTTKWNSALEESIATPGGGYWHW